MEASRSLYKKAYPVVGEHKPTKKQSACLNCNIDVKKCKGAEKCVQKQMEIREERANAACSN